MENQETKNTGIDFKSMNNRTKFLLGSALTGIISCFLPLFSGGSDIGISPSLFDGGGYGFVIFIGFLGVLIVNLFPASFTNSVKLTKVFTVAVGSLWGFLLTILLLASWAQGVSPLPVEVSLFDYLGIGFYLTSISLIVMVFACFTETE